MDSELRKMLQELLSLTEENNKMLKKVRGVQKREAFFGALKFIIIVGIGFGVFYYIEPYVNQIIDIFGTVSGLEQQLNSESLNVESLLKNFSR